VTTWWEREGLTGPCPNWRPETRRCNCKACRARRRSAVERTRARPHVRNPGPEGCPGCDDELGLPRRGSHLVPGTALFPSDHRACNVCGTTHLDGPCSKPCVCRCRNRDCNARLDCRGTPEDWTKPLNEAARLALPEHRR
jgi:hypothetical protein